MRRLPAGKFLFSRWQIVSLVCSRYIYACSLAWSAATSPMTALLKLTHRNNSTIKKIAGSAAFTLHARRLICSSLRGVSACACGFVYLNAAAVRVLRVHIRFFFLKFIFLERKKILFFLPSPSLSSSAESLQPHVLERSSAV